jgi:hypothetical protein
VARSDVERPPLPAAIRFAIAFLAMDAAGLTLVAGRFSAMLSWSEPDDALLLISLGGLAGWVVAAVGAVAGLLGRRRGGWLAAFTLTTASAALLLAPVAAVGIPSAPLLRILAFLLASVLVPSILLLAGRRDYLAEADGRP